MKSIKATAGKPEPRRLFVSVRMKAVALVGLSLAATSMVTIGHFSHRARTLVFSHSEERLTAIVDSFAFNAEYGLLVHDTAVLAKLANSVQKQKDILAAFIIDPQGNLVMHSLDTLTVANVESIARSFPRDPSVPGASPVSFYRTMLPAYGKVDIIGKPILSEKKTGSEELGLFTETGETPKETIGYAVIAFSPKSIESEITGVQREVFMISGILAAAILLLVFILTFILSKSLQRLTVATRRIGQGEISTRVRVKSKDEIEDLADGLNAMAEDLQKTTVSRDSLVKEIEERKRLENVVLQSEKMAAVGQLAGGVAHEINNPLGVILGFAQSLVRRLQPGDPYDMPLRSIEREALRCKNLVQDLLTFSRTARTEKEETNLSEAIEGALSLILAQSKVKDVSLVKELAPDLPLIMASKNQLQQVIVNLSNNAIDAMPSGGTLTIRTRKGSLKNNEAVQILVEDTGQGIKPEILTKIFEPFFTTKEVGKGTGLGLSLVFEIIQKHEGQISVDSKEGMGTKFSILLPVGST